jgi:hypothetical protein
MSCSHVAAGKVELDPQGSLHGVCKYCGLEIVGAWKKNSFTGWETSLGVASNS